MPRLLVLALLLAGCDPPASPAARPSLVLVTLDTTRADRIGAYGHAPAVTPTLDRLAAEGVRFDRAYATVPLTTPAHASMLTGVYPPRHGIHGNGDAALPASFVTLAEHLDAAGYDTAAAVSAFVTTRVWGLDQGFDAYLDAVSPRHPRGARWGQERPASAVVDDLVGWLDGRDGDAPFFLWAHFYDPHDPYAPPPGWTERAGGDPYDGEIAFMDAQLARLQARVEAAAGPGGVAWIAVADHGEALDGEHGEQRHGLFLFEPTVRVPFIVRPAAPLASGRVEAGVAVSGVDVLPTALGLLGLPVPDGLDGVDLSAAAGAAAPPLTRPPVVLEAEAVATRFGFAPERAAVEGPWKLLATPSPRLFDVDADPGEAANRVADHPARVARLQAAVDGALAGPAAAPGGAPGPEVTEQLAALGYVTHDLGAGGGGADAKDHRDVIETLDRARLAARRPQTAAEAERLLRDVLDEHPDMGEAALTLGRVLGAQGRRAEARALLEAVVARHPTSTVARTNLAIARAADGDLDGAIADADAILGQVPGDRQARDLVLRLLTDQGRPAEALARARAWALEDPGDIGLEARMGVALFQLGRGEEAEAHLLRGLSDGVPRRHVQRALGMLALSRGDLEAGGAWLEAESDAWPADPRTRWELGNLRMSQERWDEAAAEYAALVHVRPGEVPPRRAWAQATFNAGAIDDAAAILAPALAPGSEDADVWLLHANILARTGRMAEAEAAAAEARRLHALRTPGAPRP